MEKRRKLIQVICAVLYNCNFTGFAKGKIYQGDIKGVCVPGLNCYSCPGAIASCPLGSLQSALVSSKYKFPYYILGLLLLFGVVLGRVICGFLCPFGLIQEILYKIPTPKLKKNRWTRRLSYVKYVILVVFVVGIPLVWAVPGFCKYICPAGTLEGGIPLVAMNEGLKAMTGGLYWWKIFLLVVILLSSVFIFRSFCRFLCPLGAFYSFFHGVSILGMKVDAEKCNHCNACVAHCKMDVKKVGDRECIQCGECKEHCRQCALTFGKK
ncbi:MAG: 4Fe-4S binding protein [Lachnospiraceae bacterium]|nr:4Fe-4S binding protein [Lachnospiraceae bacterium]